MLYLPAVVDIKEYEVTLLEVLASDMLCLAHEISR